MLWTVAVPVAPPSVVYTRKKRVTEVAFGLVKLMVIEFRSIPLRILNKLPPAVLSDPPTMDPLSCSVAPAPVGSFSNTQCTRSPGNDEIEKVTPVDPIHTGEGFTE